MVVTSKITLHSPNPAPKLVDITDQVEEMVKKSGVQEGQALIFAQHTTAALTIQENEEGLKKDLAWFLDTLAPKDYDYHHHQSFDHQHGEPPNGHAHCQHVVLGPSEIIPVSQGKILLGRYQKIFLVELDRKRLRTIVIQVMGE